MSQQVIAAPAAGTQTGWKSWLSLENRFVPPVFIPLILAGNVLGAALQFPEIGSAVLFPPYAALAAALVVARRREWAWYIVTAAIAHAIPSLSKWSLSWVLGADVANIFRAVLCAVLLRSMFRGLPRIGDVTSFLKFVFAAVLLTFAIQPLFGGKAPLVFFSIAVILSASYAGMGAGLAATALSVFVALVLFEALRQQNFPNET